MNRSTEILPTRPVRHGALQRVRLPEGAGRAPGQPRPATTLCPAVHEPEAAVTCRWLGRLLPFRLIDDD